MERHLLSAPVLLLETHTTHWAWVIVGRVMKSKDVWAIAESSMSGSGCGMICNGVGVDYMHACSAVIMEACLYCTYSLKAI